MNGANIGAWTETDPAQTESVGLGDDRMQSIKTTFRTALNDEHNWPSSSGDSFGVHRAGSARPYFGTQSRVSSSGTDGRLMLASDTSNLFAVGSGGTVLLGSPRAVSMQSSAGSTFPSRHYWAMDSGFTTVQNSVITFAASGFSGIPFIFVTSHVTSSKTYLPSFFNPSKESFLLNPLVDLVDQTVIAGASGVTVFWISIGTRAL